MVWEHEKSGTTVFLDVIRHLLVLAGTIFVVFLIWKRNWIFALIAAIPIYIGMLNLVGFLTLPFYMLTPEKRMKAKSFKAFQNGDFETGKDLTDEFKRKFNVNVPNETQNDSETKI